MPPITFALLLRQQKQKTYIPFKEPANLGAEHRVSVLFIFIVITVLFLLWDVRQTFLSLMKEQKHPLCT